MCEQYDGCTTISFICLDAYTGTIALNFHLQGDHTDVIVKLGKPVTQQCWKNASSNDTVPISVWHGWKYAL